MKQLAQRIGVEPRSISAYEKGEFVPRGNKLERLAQALDFPETFFFGDDLDEPAPDAASFRSLTKMTASQRNTALGSGTIGILLNDWIEARFELPMANLPDLSQEVSPEAAAHLLRRTWGLGELPIKNMIHLLESKGVRVFSLVMDALEVDAFSMWRQETPFVFLNTQKSAERTRFDAAHELGHLVLHRHGSPQGQDAEREANAFASAFLMPRASVLANAPRMATLDHLIQLKKYWTVSVAALVYRFHAVGVLTDWHHRSLYIEIGKRGYRVNEPNESPRESSQLLQKIFASIRADGMTQRDIAEALSVNQEEIQELVFGLTISSVGTGSERGEFAMKPQPSLKIVK